MSVVMLNQVRANLPQHVVGQEHPLSCAQLVVPAHGEGGYVLGQTRQRTECLLRILRRAPRDEVGVKQVRADSASVRVAVSTQLHDRVSHAYHHVLQVDAECDVSVQEAQSQYGVDVSARGCGQRIDDILIQVAAKPKPFAFGEAHQNAHAANPHIVKLSLSHQHNSALREGRFALWRMLTPQVYCLRNQFSVRVMHALAHVRELEIVLVRDKGCVPSH